MAKNDKIKTLKVAITGPESTGKTELTRQLSAYFDGTCILEYARKYVESLQRPYNYLDVLHIAYKQILESQGSDLLQTGYVFLDTELIITKVWLELVYGFCPDWINTAITSSRIDLYLLCNLDIPWIQDKVRENGGEMREKLFHIYEQLIQANGFRYKVIEGTGDLRLRNALLAIGQFEPNGLN